MFTVSKEKADQRWEILPPALREALFSDVSGDFVWNLCQDNHLTEEKSYRVAEFAGYVLYGFLHPEDLAAELVKSLELPAPLAKTLSDAINARIFVPLKADLDKVYSPLIKPITAGAAPVPTGPKMIQDVGAAAPKPTILSDVGWSKLSPTSVPAAPRPPAPPAPVASNKSAEPAPVMLHEDTAFKAVEKNASFTLSRPASGAEVHMPGPSTVPVPPRAAVLEFGGAKPPAQTNPSASANFGSSFSSAPTANTGPRSVSQIVPPSSPSIPPSIPKPPAPPAAPQPPTPPQSGKPIVKDFL